MSIPADEVNSLSPEGEKGLLWLTVSVTIVLLLVVAAVS